MTTEKWKKVTDKQLETLSIPIFKAYTLRRELRGLSTLECTCYKMTSKEIRLIGERYHILTTITYQALLVGETVHTFQSYKEIKDFTQCQ